MAQLPLNDLKFIEFGITYMMLAPSRLQLGILGPELDVDETALDADFENVVKTALADAGFHSVDQVYTHFRPYIQFLSRNQHRELLHGVKQLLIDSGEYSDDPPHPRDGSGQSLLSALEGLAGRKIIPHHVR